MPPLILLFLMAIVDRQNVGFAKLQMASGLGMTEAAFGFGASLFFIGYVVFELPSALLIQKLGAGIWMARIAFIWGVITLAFAATPSESVFWILRFLLGVAQAGFYPAAIFFIAFWFPGRYRIPMLGLFSLGSALGNSVGGVINGALLSMDGFLNLEGWRWVFLGSGFPTIVLSLFVGKWLPGNAGSAQFLNDEDRRIWSAAQARHEPPMIGDRTAWMVLWDIRVLGLSIVYILFATSFYASTYWLPTIVHQFGVTASVNGLLNALPWTIGACLLLVVPFLLRHEDNAFRAGMILGFVGAFAFGLSIVITDPIPRYIALAIASPCITLLNPFFWSLPPRLFSGIHAASSIAAINSIGNLGGFFAQNLVPWADEAAPFSGGAMLVPAVCMCLIGIAAACAAVRAGNRPQAKPSAAA